MGKTASMHITRAKGSLRCPSRTGFTLTEVLIAVSLGAIIMLAVLTAFLMIGRSTAAAVNYIEMEKQARQGMERFGQDVRMAQYLTTVSANQVTLTIPSANGTDDIDYIYDSSAKTFTRNGRDPVTYVANTSTTLIKNVQNCEFRRWMLGSTGPANSDASADQLQIRLTISQKSVTVATNTNLVVSARFVMRNHRANTIKP